MKGCIVSVVIALVIVCIGFYFINKASVKAHHDYENEVLIKKDK